MKTLQFSAGQGVRAVRGTATFCGKDVSVSVGGGDTPHIGAVAVASPRPSLKKDGSPSASASVLCLVGHKEDMAARNAALRLATVLGVNVSVAVGLHIDDATPTDIQALEDNFNALLEEMAGALKGS